MLGPGEFFYGLALGGQQFFAGTVGMCSRKLLWYDVVVT